MSYTWVTYQLYMMGLSIVLFVGLVATEFFLRKFDVLHVVYNQMLRLKEMKLICFNQFDVTSNYRVVSALFMMTRLTVILVLCYIWQFCVLESHTMADSAFPEPYCFPDSQIRCFQTPLKWDSFIRASEMTQIDCNKGINGYVPVASSTAVGCFKVIDQNAAVWLQTLAVANALGLLMIRVFEVIIWVSFQSLTCMIVLSVLALLLLVAVVLTAVSGSFSSFVNTWLGFIALSICPFMVYLARKAALEIRKIKRTEMAKIQQQAKSDFKNIASDFASSAPTPEEPASGPIMLSARSASSNNSRGLRLRH